MISSKDILIIIYIQGDKEVALGNKVSYLCNRYETNIAKSQIGFIDFIVQPSFEALG